MGYIHSVYSGGGVCGVVSDRTRPGSDPVPALHRLSSREREQNRLLKHSLSLLLRTKTADGASLGELGTVVCERLARLSDVTGRHASSLRSFLPDIPRCDVTSLPLLAHTHLFLDAYKEQLPVTEKQDRLKARGTSLVFGKSSPPDLQLWAALLYQPLEHLLQYSRALLSLASSYHPSSSLGVYPLSCLWVQPVTEAPNGLVAIKVTTPEESFTLVSSTAQDRAVNGVLGPEGQRSSSRLAVAMAMSRSTSYTFKGEGRLREAVYTGAWLAGRMHGRGTLKWPDGRSYSGTFRDGLEDGSGHWRDGQIQGYGTYRYASGEVYEGCFHDGQRHGYGMLTSGRPAKANIFIGQWVHDKKTGYGVSDDIIRGEKYMGEWQGDQRQGVGVLLSQSGLYYQGSFRDHRMAGQGLLVTDDDTSFRGEFSEDWTINGKGHLCVRSGEVLEDQRYQGVFEECLSRLGCTSPGTRDQETAWNNVAITMTGCRRESPDLSRSQNRLLEGLEVIPQHGEPLTASAYDNLCRYLAMAFATPLHPLGWLLETLVMAYRVTYVGAGCHPRLLPQAVTELQSYLPRILSVVRYSLVVRVTSSLLPGEILTSVMEEIRRAVTRDISGAQLLHMLLRAPWLHGLLKVYDCLLEFKTLDHRATLPHASGLAYQIMDELRMVDYPSDEARELYEILQSPHIQGVLSSHDSVALSDYEPVLLPLPEEIPGDEDAMRIVCLVKNDQPLGATIKRDEETGEIYIARVIHGGLADRSGLLHPGDLLLEVNGNPVEGLEPEQVIQILIHSQGTILFKVIPNTPQNATTNSSVVMRAMVDYSPEQDWSLPCPDVGMSFRKGQLLEVVDQTDGHWWQARKLPITNSCAGLIPSASMLKSKRREQWWSQPVPIPSSIHPDEAGSDIIDGIYLAGFRRSFRLWRRMAYRGCRLSCYSCSPQSSLSNPYEEVVLYQRSPQDKHRLIVLVGASGVGVNELRRNLIKTKPSSFQGPIPYTTRPIKEGELSGREYHFVTRELFEYMVCNNRFLEYGLSRGHLYGTSSESIGEVLKTGRMCIIDAEPHLKPYVIFIRPPERHILRLTRGHARILTSCDTCRPFTEEDCEELEEASGLMEMRHRQLFDRTVENGSLEKATAELLSVIQEAQEEAQWVPVPWSVEEPRREDRRDKNIREERRGGLTYTMDYTKDVY
ncbi:hypothetical protein NHX12_006804 [Muraenolepis orangiensis]|uniref:Uncharacterized protein n=1 Tax=Muraenolepis orangiensis TaxID=630683 RepID=A0A9Q0I944_9TELE|nr:hypothetical protein NHX12_006804 [Muraenolepis orangiensis]